MKTTVLIMEKIVGMSVTKQQDRVVGVVLMVGAAVKILNTMDVVVLLMCGSCHSDRVSNDKLSFEF